MLSQQLFNGLVVGAVYALFALGFNLIFGVLKIMNLAHGAIFMVGAFVALYAVLAGAPLWVAFPLAMLATGLLSILLDLTAFQPLRKRGEAEFAAIISSIGADMILMNVAMRASEAQVKRFPFGLVPTTAIEFLGLRVTPLQLVISIFTCVLVIGLSLYLYRTSFGRQVRAVASNEKAATLLGVEPRIVYMQTFFLAGALAGAAGILIGLTFNSINFMMGEPYLLRGFVVLILGGLGSLSGAIVTALLLGMVQTVTVAYLPSGLSDIIIYSLLFVMLVIRPNGLFGIPVATSGIGRR